MTSCIALEASVCMTTGKIGIPVLALYMRRDNINGRTGLLFKVIVEAKNSSTEMVEKPRK